MNNDGLNGQRAASAIIASVLTLPLAHTAGADEARREEAG